MRITHEAGGYVAECRCGWARWNKHRAYAEQAAMTHAEKCREVEESC